MIRQHGMHAVICDIVKVHGQNGDSKIFNTNNGCSYFTATFTHLVKRSPNHCQSTRKLVRNGADGKIYIYIIYIYSDKEIPSYNC